MVDVVEVPLRRAVRALLFRMRVKAEGGASRAEEKLVGAIRVRNRYLPAPVTLGAHVIVGSGVGSGVGLGVGVAFGSGVGVGGGGTLTPHAETLLVSIVTAPVIAMTLPATLAPKFKVTLVLATICPTN